MWWRHHAGASTGIWPPASLCGFGPSSYLQKTGDPGFELQSGKMVPLSCTSFLGARGQQLPGLQLGLAQDGHMRIWSVEPDLSADGAAY